MPHTRAWDETQPPNSQAVNLGPTRFHDFRQDVRERMAIDHVWNVSTTLDGFHKQVTMAEMADPSNPAADYAIIYVKDSGGTTHLFMKDSAGTVRQLTGTVSGVTVPWANLSGIPVLVSGLGALADPGADSYLVWNDASNLLEFRSIASAANSVLCGYVGSDGSTGNRLPAGWSVSKTGTGTYEVTHSLGLADGTRLGVVAVPSAAVSNGCRIETGAPTTGNKFTVTTYTTSSGTAADSAFFFFAKQT